MTSQRRSRPTVYELRLPALEVRQGTRRLYSFAVDGKQLPLFATISRTVRGASASAAVPRRCCTAISGRSISSWARPPEDCARG